MPKKNRIKRLNRQNTIPSLVYIHSKKLKSGNQEHNKKTRSFRRTPRVKRRAAAENSIKKLESRKHYFRKYYRLGSLRSSDLLKVYRKTYGEGLRPGLKLIVRGRRFRPRRNPTNRVASLGKLVPEPVEYLTYSNSFTYGTNSSRMHATITCLGFKNASVFSPKWLYMSAKRIGYLLYSEPILSLRSLELVNSTSFDSVNYTLPKSNTSPKLQFSTRTVELGIEPLVVGNRAFWGSNIVASGPGVATPLAFLLLKSCRQSERANLDFRVGGIPSSALRSPRFRETYNSDANDFSRAGRFFVGPTLVNTFAFGAVGLKLGSLVRGSLLNPSRKVSEVSRFSSHGRVHRYIRRIASRFVSWRPLSRSVKKRYRSKDESFYGQILRYRLTGYGIKYFFNVRKLPKPAYGVRKKSVRRSLRYNRIKSVTKSMLRARKPKRAPFTDSCFAWRSISFAVSQACRTLAGYSELEATYNSLSLKSTKSRQLRLQQFTSTSTCSNFSLNSILHFLKNPFLEPSSLHSNLGYVSRVNRLYGRVGNLLPESSFRYAFFKKLINSFAQNKQNSFITPWYYNNIIRFVEFMSGRKVLLQFYMFMAQEVSKDAIARYRLWMPRMGYYERKLGHRFFLEEAIHIFHLGFVLRDVTLITDWFKSMILRISFWKTRSIFRFIKYLMNNYFVHIFDDLGAKGLKIRLKGKISVAGNSRKRTILYRVGKTSHSEVSLRVLQDMRTINTFTGVLGFQIWLFF